MKKEKLRGFSSGFYMLMETDVENQYIFLRADKKPLENIGNKPIQMYHNFFKKRKQLKESCFIEQTFDIEILPDKTKALVTINERKIEIDEDIKIYQPKKLGGLK